MVQNLSHFCIIDLANKKMKKNAIMLQLEGGKN